MLQQTCHDLSTVRNLNSITLKILLNVAKRFSLPSSFKLNRSQSLHMTHYQGQHYQRRRKNSLTEAGQILKKGWDKSRCTWGWQNRETARKPWPLTWGARCLHYHFYLASMANKRAVCTLIKTLPRCRKVGTTSRGGGGREGEGGSSVFPKGSDRDPRRERGGGGEES